MAIETISYSRAASGWNSFHSFNPDWMIGLNSSLYTWKNGNLYKHHSNETRNNYYGVQYNSTITPIFNQDPTDTKIFKTIALEGNARWQADIETDLSTGIVEPEYYKEKEGTLYAYLRRDPNTIDPKAMSTQGIGEVDTFVTDTITISGVDSLPSIAVGDLVYISDGTTLSLVEAIVSHSGNTITVDTPVTTTPSPGDFIVVVKDSTAESFGARGYYMEAKLTNTDTTPVELFVVSSEASKSYP